MISRILKQKSIILLTVIFSIVLPLFCFANSYSNNSISIEVNPEKRTYDYKDIVSLNIKIENKNRYAKLYYKISDIYSGGGFSPLNLSSNENVIDELGNVEEIIELKDNYAGDNKDKTRGTHLKTYSVGTHVYEIPEKDYEDFVKYRKPKATVEKTPKTDTPSSERDKLEYIKGKINATLLIVVIILLICIILIAFIWFIIKSKSGGGFKYMSILLVIGLISLTFNNRAYASDTYQENITYTKEVNTRCTYWELDCSFRVTVEYYFVNSIAPITNLELDTDNDNLHDYLEVLYLTDLNNADTDSDGIPDGDEVYHTFTDPLNEDTDSNGTNDGDEDYDSDKLTNIEEYNNGTFYDNSDTDLDNLTDYEEVQGVTNKAGTITYNTDPTLDDTDGDGLRDDIEIKLGLNPTNSSDGDTKVSQESDKTLLPKDINECSTPVSFYGNLQGSIDENVKVKLSENNYFNDLETKVGEPITIDTTYDGLAGLKIKIDVSKYGNIKDRLQLCRYEDGKIVTVSGTYISGDNLLGDVYSGDYVLIDSEKIIQDYNIFMN